MANLDDALDALLARYVPGSMLDSVGTAELVEHATRLRTERDTERKAYEDTAEALGMAEHPEGQGGLHVASPAELVRYVKEVIRGRDQAVDDAAFLSGCAAQLLHGGDALLEECRETVLDELQRLMRRRFDVLRVADVMERYADVPERGAA
jgi:anthranilate phosphoribosyltransferase